MATRHIVVTHAGAVAAPPLPPGGVQTTGSIYRDWPKLQAGHTVYYLQKMGTAGPRGHRHAVYAWREKWPWYHIPTIAKSPQEVLARYEQAVAKDHSGGLLNAMDKYAVPAVEIGMVAIGGYELYTALSPAAVSGVAGTGTAGAGAAVDTAAAGVGAGGTGAASAAGAVGATGAAGGGISVAGIGTGIGTGSQVIDAMVGQKATDLVKNALAKPATTAPTTPAATSAPATQNKITPGKAALGLGLLTLLALAL